MGTEWETSSISRATAPSRRVCPTRRTTARQDACSTCQSRRSASSSTSAFAERSFPRGSIVRVEHVKHSQCRQEFLDRVVSNDERKEAANAEGKRVVLKRQPRQPREARTVDAKTNVPQMIAPIPYEFICYSLSSHSQNTCGIYYEKK